MPEPRNPSRTLRMHDFYRSAATSLTDQADGLRRLFAGTQPQHLALVANPHVAFSSVVLERLTTVLGAMGQNILVVDAADSSPAPHELAALDLRACIEPLSSQVSYLAARGLPLRHVDTRGSSADFLDRVQAAAPQARVLLVHAGAPDLARLFGRRALRPMLLAADEPHSLTHAYASMKLLVMRCALMSYDLLLAAAPSSRRVPAIAQRLASCADGFLGAALHDWVAIDPACDVRERPGEALQSLVAAQLRLDAEVLDAVEPDAAAWRMPAAAASGAMQLN
jgi:flagellar biosynthesis protein FlhG